MHRRWTCLNPSGRRLGRLLSIAALAGFLGAGVAQAAKAPVSSCVACHTDAEKLKIEAAKVPPPAASALQAGKG